MKKIVFVTYPARAAIAEDDRLAIPFLSGCRIEAHAWDEPAVEWEKYDAVVLRSCWDYHLRFEEFSEWLDGLEKSGAKLFNDARTVRRNADKFYLRDLAKLGVPVIPTVWFEKNRRVAVSDILRELDWEKAVVKPAISATAFQTWVTFAETADRQERILDRMLENSAVLLQPFIAEVVTKGEWSFVFFDKKYSHAALKRAKTGDFRVQTQFGGYVDERRPSASLIEQAKAVLNSVDEDLLYARVDGVEIDGKFHLMELELIEPVLFLTTDAEAPKRFAGAILSKLENRYDTSA